MREEQTDVLIVGAGPVGLWAALLLSETGLRATIIDREERTAARSYACALHPTTLKLLHRFEVIEPLLEQGRRVPAIAFYDPSTRRAEVPLSAASPDFPFLLIIPQNILEATLEAALKKRGLSVRWNHRFDTLDLHEDVVIATIEELGGTSTGYIIPHWEMTVKNRYRCSSRFIIGADGHDSLVRQRSGIQNQLYAPPQSFAACECSCDEQLEDELRVVLDQVSTSVLWPLAENRFRWTFQMVRSDSPAEFPEKERRAVRLANKQVDESIRAYVEKVAQRRAPWFSAGIKEITWCAQVGFARQLATTFLHGRSWLAGDSAHQTGPVGVQSMNAGFLETDLLAKRLPDALRENGSLGPLSDLSTTCQTTWRKMLGVDGGLKPSKNTDPWIAAHASRILPCLPGVGPDLAALAKPLHLDYV